MSLAVWILVAVLAALALVFLVPPIRRALVTKRTRAAADPVPTNAIQRCHMTVHSSERQGRLRPILTGGETREVVTRGFAISFRQPRGAIGWKSTRRCDQGRPRAPMRPQVASGSALRIGAHEIPRA